MSSLCKCLGKMSLMIRIKDRTTHTKNIPTKYKGSKELHSQCLLLFFGFFGGLFGSDCKWSQFYNLCKNCNILIAVFKIKSLKVFKVQGFSEYYSVLVMYGQSTKVYSCAIVVLG